MSDKHLSYDEAVDAFFKVVETTRVIPKQPNRTLSELRGRTWYLRNGQGPLARVNHEGKVRSRIIEDQYSGTRG